MRLKNRGSALRFRELADRASGAARSSWRTLVTYAELVSFPENRMHLSNAYQPLVMSHLVRSRGVATVEELAVSSLTGDERVIDYYARRVRETEL